jgi:hypothetical protein
MRIFRSVISFVLILSSTGAWALPSFVAKWVKTPGFIHPPLEETVYLRRSGWILLVVKNQNGGVVQQRYLGRLTNFAFQATIKKINAVNASSPWVDQNPGAPFCTDMPGYFVSIVQGDHEVRTYQKTNCHTFTEQDHSADPINDVMLGLGALAE